MKSIFCEWSTFWNIAQSDGFYECFWKWLTMQLSVDVCIFLCFLCWSIFVSTSCLFVFHCLGPPARQMELSFRTTVTRATTNSTSTSSSTGRGNLPIGTQRAMGGALGAIQKRISSTKANANNRNDNSNSFRSLWALTPASGRGQTLYYQSQEVPTSRARQTQLIRKSTESIHKNINIWKW